MFLIRGNPMKFLFAVSIFFVCLLSSISTQAMERPKKNKPRHVFSPQRRLIMEIGANDLAAIKEAIQDGANVNIGNKKGWMPLMHAASRGSQDVVNFLLDAGADPNARSKYGYSAQTAADQTIPRNDHIIKLLKARGAIGSAQRLFIPSPIPTLPPEILIHIFSYVAEAKNLEEAFAQLARLALTNTTFAEIARDGNFIKELARVQIKKDLQNAREEFYDAAKTGKSWIVKAYLEADIGNNQEFDVKFVALGWAVINGYLDIVRMLVEYGACIDSKTKKGLTPLMLAVWHDRKTTVEYLLRLNANANAQDNKGNTALMLAVMKNDRVLIHMLKPVSQLDIKNCAGEKAIDFVSRWNPMMRFALRSADEKKADGK